MNVAAMLTAVARRHPERDALIYDDRRRTYAEFDARVAAIAAGLRDAGLSPGARVLLIQRNRPELVESLLGCLRAGLVAVPLNFRLHPEEVAYIADNSRAGAMIVAGEFAGGAAAAEAARPGMLAFSTDGDWGARPYEQLANWSRQMGDAEVGDEDPAWLFFTSGTTGHPKGALLPHRVIWAETFRYYADIGQIHATDVALHSAPLTHGSGFFAFPFLARGAAHVIQHTPSFEPAVALDLMKRHGVTHIPFVAPTMVNRLVDEVEAGGTTSSLRSLVYGGAPMYVEDLRRALDGMGPILTQVYGQGEAGTITCLPAEEHVTYGDPQRERRLASAGTARTGMQVVILGEDDQPVPPGVTGEICVRGPVVMTGYWRDPEATSLALRGGWLRTGDRGECDDHGYLFISGRSKDMIISGGVNIYPREIEDVLLRHPGVEEVAVIGIPDPQWGESVRAVVVPARDGARKPKIGEAELVAHCLDHLGSYKKPRSIVFADALPKTAYGKVSKLEVAERYGAARGQEQKGSP